MQGSVVSDGAPVRLRGKSLPWAAVLVAHVRCVTLCEAERQRESGMKHGMVVLKMPSKRRHHQVSGRGAGPHANDSAGRVSPLSARGWYSGNHRHVPRCLSFASQAHECDSNEHTPFFPSLRKNTGLVSDGEADEKRTCSERRR